MIDPNLIISGNPDIALFSGQERWGRRHGYFPKNDKNASCISISRFLDALSSKMTIISRLHALNTSKSNKNSREGIDFI